MGWLKPPTTVMISDLKKKHMCCSRAEKPYPVFSRAVFFRRSQEFLRIGEKLGPQWSEEDLSEIALLLDVSPQDRPGFFVRRIFFFGWDVLFRWQQKQANR